MEKTVILNVDDDEVGRYAKTRTLRLAGYEVIDASTGQEALDLAVSSRPEVILLDVKLPDINGFEVCRRLKADPRTAMIMVLQVSASFVTAEDRVQGLEGGADGYLTSPIETAVLLATIRALLRARRAEAEVIRSQEQLNEFFENAAMGLQWLDREGTVLRANQAQLELVGCGRGKYEGRNLAEFLIPPEAGHELVRRLNAGETLHNYHARLRSCDGPPHDVLINANALWENGRFVHGRCFMRDITEIKRMNLALQESERRLKSALQAADQHAAELEVAKHGLEEASRAKDEFLATVSHELRTPLTAIVGWSKLLLRGQAGEMKHALEIVERSAQSLSKIVEDLLDMSRVISGRISLRRELTEIEPILRNAVEGVSPAAAAKNIQLNCSIAPGPLRVWCDPSRVQQVVWNLLTNAVKFTPPGGKVSLFAEPDGDFAQITVDDTGEGISPAFLPHVFDRFRQADASISRRQGGLGLGLAISKQLVELHGGSIRAESAGPGQGAQFVVRFPARWQPGEPAPLAEVDSAMPRAAEISENALAGTRILIVEDDPDASVLVSRVLRSAGADVTCAASAHEGLRLLRELAPHLVVSDISMPEKDGYEFVRELRSLNGACAQVPCVALTALARPEDRSQALQAGYDEHVSKPFDPVHLVRAVNSALGRKQAARQAHVLLAEDNPDVAELMRLSLEEHGYCVSIADTIAGAIAIAERSHIDVLISDLRLEDGNGWELLAALRAHGPVPGIVISGFSDPSYIDQSKAAGFTEYLVKPVDDGELVQAVTRVLATTAAG